jgi:hypothetical protein
MKVIYKKEAEREEPEYQQMCCEELDRLKCFRRWGYKKDDDTVIYFIGKEYANSDIFIRCGLLQKALHNIAFFRGGYGHALSLKRCSGVIWKEVYTILSSIDHIDIGD